MGYTCRMDVHDTSNFDTLFETARAQAGLTWYPWVGKDFESSSPRILVVGESHYVRNDFEKKPTIQEKIQEWQDDRTITRVCIMESCINGEWMVPTWQQLQYALAGSEQYDNLALWEHIAYYNFVQRAMDYETQTERPNEEDFAKGWETFAAVASALKPDYCVFFGVTAANFFNWRMKELGIEHKQVEPLPIISNCYPRKASVTIAGKQIPMLFMRHSGSYFSWPVWHDLLKQEMPAAAAALHAWCRAEE